MRERIMKIMTTVFEQPTTDNSSVDNVENWDSLHHINLIVALEKEFGITIPEDDISNMINFKLIELIIDEQVRV